LPKKKNENAGTGLFLILLGVIIVLQYLFPSWLQWSIGSIFLIGLGYIVAIQHDKEKTNEILSLVGSFVIDLIKAVLGFLSFLIKKYVIKENT